jgi:hypothetical protein
LQNFINSATHEKTDIRIDANLELRIFPAEKPRSTFFVMAGRSDGQSGGFILSELERNLRICVDEKTAKTKSVRSKYPVWWLVLVDHVAFGPFGLDADEIEQFKRDVKLSHPEWDRITIVNPHNPARYFDV